MMGMGYIKGWGVDGHAIVMDSSLVDESKRERLNANAFAHKDHVQQTFLFVKESNMLNARG